jgi:hypothetical protein
VCYIVLQISNHLYQCFHHLNNLKLNYIELISNQIPSLQLPVVWGHPNLNSCAPPSYHNTIPTRLDNWWCPGSAHPSWCDNIIRAGNTTAIKMVLIAVCGTPVLPEMERLLFYPNAKIEITGRTIANLFYVPYPTRTRLAIQVCCCSGLWNRWRLWNCVSFVMILGLIPTGSTKRQVKYNFLRAQPHLFCFNPNFST